MGFRITPWPGSSLDAAEVVLPVAAWREGDRLVYAPDQEAEHTTPLPDEFVLRQLPEVDLGDFDGLMGIVQEHGVIGVERDPFPQWRRHGKPVVRPSADSVHLEEVARRLAMVRSATAYWVAMEQGTDKVTPWTAEGFAVDDEEEAAWRFSQTVSTGLRSFPPRITFEGSTPTASPTFRSFGGAVPELVPAMTGVPRPSLYEALCLQVFNLYVDKLPPKECGNERCRRLFVRQQGRAQYDQRRTSGIKYCSKACATAQTQREYRRREQAKKGRGKV